MDVSFDLLDEPWIPCLVSPSGNAEELGLRALLARSHEIREIVDPSPIVTVAIHRLILAILHRNFGPRSSAAWAELRARGRWDTDRLDEYFATSRPRFDLFRGGRPFYQDIGLDFQYATPLARRAREVASYTDATLFDHTPSEAPEGVSPARAARFIVGHQAFTVGGLVSLERGQDPKRFKSAYAGPLNKGAVGLIKGATLFETLLLNLHGYHREEPFAWTADEDLPAWERASPPTVEERLPTGYLDLLTWQSRRIRLRPEADPNGTIRVRQAVIMKGDQMPATWHRKGRETMLAFVKREKPPKGQDPWPAVGFREDRALWRDSLALFQSLPDQQARPMMVDWVAELASEGYLPFRRVLAIDFCGLATNQAVVNFWRHERVALPLAYLDNDDLVDQLREALARAERGATALADSTWLLASLLVAPDSDVANGRQPDRDAVRACRDGLAPARAYWSKLEAPFRRLLVELPDDEQSIDGGVVYGRRTLPAWTDLVRSTTWRAFHEATTGLGGSARSLKALAAGERRLAFRLREELGGAPIDQIGSGV